MKIHTTVKSNSRHREEVLQYEDGSCVVHTKAPAIKNRANLAVAALLAVHFGVSKNRVRLIRGHTSKLKMYEVDQASL